MARLTDHDIVVLADMAVKAAESVAGHHLATNEEEVWTVFDALKEAFLLGAESQQEVRIVHVDRCDECESARILRAAKYK